MKINRNFPSPNYSPRGKSIEYIILHFTEMDFNDALAKMRDDNESVSAHYLIKNDGEIFQLVNDDHKAWHAGISSWKGCPSLNQNSIGIELDNLGNHEFSKHQMNSCVELCKKLSTKYDILPGNIIGHSDIAPDRKIDPGLFFPWEILAKSNLGIWHKIDVNDISNCMFKFGDNSPEIKLIQQKLSKIGYKINITGEFDLQTNFVIRAFQARFYPKIIIDSGLNFYNDFTSKYIWDDISDKILDSLTIDNL